MSNEPLPYETAFLLTCSDCGWHTDCPDLECALHIANDHNKQFASGHRVRIAEVKEVSHVQ